MPESPRGKPPRGGERERRDDNTLSPLQVRYYRRMRLQRVYNVVVGWKETERRPPSGTPPVTVRLLMAGAQVVPAEHTLDPGDADATVSFYVTPLAKGWLRNERLEILVGDRKVQELAVPAKVVGQGVTLALLLLAFLLPWFCLSYGKYSTLEMTRFDLADDPARLEAAIRYTLREPREGKLDPRDPKGLMEKVQIDKERAAILEGHVPLREAVKRHPILDSLFKEPGDLLANRIKRESPDLPDFLNYDEVRDTGKTVADKIGQIYGKFIEWNKIYPIAFCLFFGLLFLALISFILHQDRRRQRISKPIAVPRGESDADDAGHSRREELAAVEME